MRTYQNCTLEKIVIEGISYLIKQFGSSTCTPQPFMVEGIGCSCCSDLPVERNVMQYQILPLKSRGESSAKVAEEIEIKLEQYCKGSKKKNNSKGFK